MQQGTSVYLDRAARPPLNFVSWDERGPGYDTIRVGG
jgi:hypothetical protein